VNNPVFVTGGSGFVGSAVVGELLSRGFSVHALVNNKPLASRPELQSFSGGVFDTAAVRSAMQSCTAVIHLIGIIFEVPSKGTTFERMHVQATQAVLDAAKELGIRRFVQMSALGTRPDAVSNYHRTKFQAEQVVQASGLDWTILRPSMIHGPAGEFMRMEAKWVRKQSPPFLFMPYFGSGILGYGGAGLLQPVFVKDVAKAFVDCLHNPKTVGKIYGVAGAERITWPQLHHQVARAITGKRRWAMPIPAWYAKLLSRIVPGSLLPFNRDQVIMSQEDNVCDMAAFVEDFGWTPEPFAASLQKYVAAL
jgi:NADH dehydrogenase